MRYTFLLIFIFPFAKSIGQTRINTSLKRELDSIYELHTMIINFSKSKDVKKKADSIMKANHFKNSNEILFYLTRLQKGYDSLNIKRIKAIIQQYGYPGKSLVGCPTNEVAFYVLQRHLNEQTKEFPQYLPILKKAAESQELPFRLYAERLDRSLLEQGKEQVYGTQIKSVTFPMGNTGMRGIKWIVWPIKDTATVNKRRKAIGIIETVEEMAKESNFVYEVYTLDDVKKLQGNSTMSSN